jgi:hypothetical protein
MLVEDDLMLVDIIVLVEFDAARQFGSRRALVDQPAKGLPSISKMLFSDDQLGAMLD